MAAASDDKTADAGRDTGERRTDVDDGGRDRAVGEIRRFDDVAATVSSDPTTPLSRATVAVGRVGDAADVRERLRDRS